MNTRATMRNDEGTVIRFRGTHSTPYQRRVRRINGKTFHEFSPRPIHQHWLVRFLSREVRTLDATIVIGAVLLIVAMLSGWPS